MSHLFRILLFCFVLPLVAVTGIGCSDNPPSPDDDDDDTVAPPDDDDDDAVSCNGDYDCDFTSGLEICSTEGQCIEGDRNNTIEEAQLLEMNASVSLPLAPAGDVDWFSFFGSPGDLVLIASSADNTDLLDTFLVFADSEGNVIGYNDDFDRVSSIAPDSRLYTGVASQGLWYFSVQDRRTWVNDPSDPPGGGPEHTYTATINSADPDNYITLAEGQDDSPEDAVVWDIAEPYVNYTSAGGLEPVEDEDWFSVPVSAGEVLRLYGFPNSGSLGSVKVEVFLPDGVTSLGHWVDMTWSTASRAWIPVLEDGDYYLRVTEEAGLGGFEYWYFLHGAKNPAKEGSPPEVEPNDSVEDATLLALGEQAFWARTYPASDVDSYRLEAEEGDAVSVSFSVLREEDETALDYQITNPTGEVVMSGAWTGGEEKVAQSVTLSAGTHHLTITPQAGDPMVEANRYYQLDVIVTRP